MRIANEVLPEAGKGATNESGGIKKLVRWFSEEKYFAAAKALHGTCSKSKKRHPSMVQLDELQTLVREVCSVDRERTFCDSQRNRLIQLDNP